MIHEIFHNFLLFLYFFPFSSSKYNKLKCHEDLKLEMNVVFYVQKAVKKTMSWVLF